MFRKHKIIENKLGEQVKTDSKWKQKLIEMETPKTKSPIYSFLVIGLLIYIWTFLFWLVYNKAYGYECSIFVVILSSLFILTSYKKDYLTGESSKSEKWNYILFFITLLFSVIIALADRGVFYVKDFGSVFLFFMKIDRKSYIALSILSFLAVGISRSYYSCPYKIYRMFYSLNKNYHYYDNDQIMIRKHFNFLTVLIFGFIPLVYITLNSEKDGYQFILKSFSMVCFLYFPNYIAGILPAKKYMDTFNKAKTIDNKKL